MHVETLVGILLFVFVFIAGGLLLLAWKLLSCLRTISLSGFRFQDRDRRDMIHLFERMEEKRSASPSREPAVLAHHSSERMQETASSSEMEREALKEGVPKREKRDGNPPLVSTEPGAETDNFEALFNR